MDLTREQIFAYYKSRIPSLKESGGELRGPCPVHQGKNDSFSINPETGTCFCHSKCQEGWNPVSLEAKIEDVSTGEAYRKVCQLLGMEEGAKHEHDFKWESSYDYVDRHGETLYQVVKKRCRCGEKVFRQRRKDENGKWIERLGAIKTVLYRLNRLASAQQVLIAEGESCVEALESLGYIATTNSGGAGKWREEYSEYLAGKDVVIFQDRDTVGREHVEDVAESLRGKAASIKIVVPQKGHDVADWIKAGANRAILDQAIQLAVPYGTVELPSSTTRNRRLERTIMATALRDADALKTMLMDLRRDDFTAPALGRIYDCLARSVENGIAPSRVTVQADLEASGALAAIGGEDTLDELYSDDSGKPEEVSNYCRSLREFTYRRDLRDVGKKISDLSLSPKPSSELAGDVRRLTQGLEGDILPENALLDFSTAVRLEGSVDKFLNPLRGVEYVDTDIPKLNQMISGFIPGTISIVAAFAGEGKSAFAAQQFLRVAKRGVPGVYFSLEMKAAAVYRRMVANLAEVDHWKFREESMDAEERARVMDAMRKMASYQQFVSNLYGHTLQQIQQATQYLVKNNWLGFMVLDYVQLMCDSGKRQRDRRDVIGEATRELNLASIKYNIPIIIVAQVNRKARESESKEPQLEHLAEAANIERDSSLVIMLSRPELHKKDGNKRKTLLNVAKQRDGATGRIDLKYLWEYYRFEQSEAN